MGAKTFKQTDVSEAARAPVEWVRPEVLRFEAGAAEFGDVSNADAQPGFS